MSRTIALRSMSTEDCPAVADLCCELGYNVTTKEVEGAWARLRADRDSLVLVAVSDGEIVGWVQATISSLIQTRRFLEVKGLVVTTGRRGTGVGRQLMAAVETWGADRGLDWVRLRSNVVRREAHAFYERLGYEREKTSYTFSKSVGAEVPDCGR